MAKPQEKKRNARLFAIPAVVALVAVLLFAFRDQLPVNYKKDDEAKEAVSREQEKDSAATNQQEKEMEGSVAANQQEEEENQGGEAYGEAAINGVDNAYVQAAGMIIEKDGRVLLQMREKTSVCACNPENEIVQREDVEYLILEGGGIEEYVGAEAAVKGSMAAETTGEFFLRIVKVDVEKEAVQEEMPQGEETAFESHRYYLIVDDVTWQEAFEDCKNRGGYLVRINSEEEFQSVIQMIEEEGKQNIHFYLGGRREDGSHEYRWVDAEDRLTGDVLNPEGTVWAAAHWMENEPSFVSDEENEMYMNLIYYKDSWVLNDVPMDITKYYPGKTGYICELDE